MPLSIMQCVIEATPMPAVHSWYIAVSWGGGALPVCSSGIDGDRNSQDWIRSFFCDGPRLGHWEGMSLSRIPSLASLWRASNRCSSSSSSFKCSSAGLRRRHRRRQGCICSLWNSRGPTITRLFCCPPPK